MLDESLKQLASRFEDIAPEEDKKPLLVLVEPSGTERKKHINRWRVTCGAIPTLVTTGTTSRIPRGR